MEHLRRVHCEDGHSESKLNFVCPFVQHGVQAPALTDKELVAPCEKSSRMLLVCKYISTLFWTLSYAHMQDAKIWTSAQWPNLSHRESLEPGKRRHQIPDNMSPKGNQTCHPHNTEGTCVVYKPWLVGVYSKYTTWDRGQRKFAVILPEPKARAIMTANFRWPRSWAVYSLYTPY